MESRTSPSVRSDHRRRMGPGYILCGGQSRRFGSDKARAPLAGSTLLQLNANWLREICDPVCAVADRPGKYHDLGIKTLADVWPGCGPLGGLHKALTDARGRRFSQWVAVGSCDQTWLNPDWLRELDLHRVRPVPEAGPSPLAIVYHTHESQSAAGKPFHPFPGLYHWGLLELIEAALDAQQLSVQRLLRSLGPRLMTVPLPADWPEIAQVNSLEDWQRYRNRDPT